MCERPLFHPHVGTDPSLDPLLTFPISSPKPPPLQEPGPNKQIEEFGQKKNATFPILGKLECENGSKTHPLYQMLRKSVDSGVVDSLLGHSIKWNFTKVHQSTRIVMLLQAVPSPFFAPSRIPSSVPFPTVTSSCAMRKAGPWAATPPPPTRCPWRPTSPSSSARGSR